MRRREAAHGSGRACADPPRTLADPAAVEAALAALKSAERPLVVVGKGAAYAAPRDEVREFIEATQLPFLASPMGKGVMPDDHPLSTAPARSHVLQNADLVFLMGARLNWIMHFGLPPRFNPDVRVIQMDIAAEEIGTNVPAEVALVGDAKAVTAQLNAALSEKPWQFGAENTWRTGIAKKIEENRATTQAMFDDDSVPMNYYRVLREIRDILPRDAIIAARARARWTSAARCCRTSSRATGSMRAASARWASGCRSRSRRRRCTLTSASSPSRATRRSGSAAWRSRSPAATACRSRSSSSTTTESAAGPSTLDRSRPVLPTAYVPQARYEKVIEAFGGKGFYVETPDELKPALDAAFAERRPDVVNIMISPQAQRKPQQFGWLTR